MQDLNYQDNELFLFMAKVNLKMYYYVKLATQCHINYFCSESYISTYDILLPCLRKVIIFK